MNKHVSILLMGALVLLGGCTFVSSNQITETSYLVKGTVEFGSILEAKNAAMKKACQETLGKGYAYFDIVGSRYYEDTKHTQGASSTYNTYQPQTFTAVTPSGGTVVGTTTTQQTHYVPGIKLDVPRSNYELVIEMKRKSGSINAKACLDKLLADEAKDDKPKKKTPSR